METLRSQDEAVGNELRDRILALIPEHPEIMQMQSPNDLFTIGEFFCLDLQPSLAQAGRALRSAQKVFAST